MDEAGKVLGAEHLEATDVRFSTSNLPVDNWKDRCVGSKAIRVVVKPAPASPPVTMDLLLRKVTTLEERLSSVEGQQVKLQAFVIRNNAVQILLHAAGEQHFRTTSCSYFSVMGPIHSDVIATTRALGISPDDLVSNADKVIDRRNSETHPGSLEILDKAVREIAEDIRPAHRRLCYWECFIVENYEIIKRAIPARFQDV
jgi:hypothetical protein